MPKLKDFIGERIRQIEESLVPLRAQRTEIDRQVAAFERELAELRAAAKAIGITNGLPEIPLGVRRRTPPKLTIKEAILEVLRDHPGGLLALDILAKINERHGLGTVRTSLSPQLTRLKQERKITNRGSTWMLAG